MSIYNNRGFIALFFVITMSLTFYAWINISSSTLFAYIGNRRAFEQERSGIANNILCIDAFIEHGVVDVGVFSRDLFFKDMNTCNVTISDTEHFFIMNKKVVFSVEKEHGFVARVVTRFL